MKLNPQPLAKRRRVPVTLIIGLKCKDAGSRRSVLSSGAGLAKDSLIGA
jgi:hypothetical protein